MVDELPRRIGERTAASVESCTGGNVAATLAAMDGASGWFRGGLVAYTEEVKRALLGVRAPSIYSEEAAAEMADGGAHLLGAAATVATTGVAGPEPVGEVPAGTVFIATVVDGVVETSTHRFSGSPERVVERATATAVELLTARLPAAPG